MAEMQQMAEMQEMEEMVRYAKDTKK